MTDPSAIPEPLLCPECRYDLSGLPTGNCPECGKAFTPEQVREYWLHRKTRKRRSGPFLYAMIAIALLTVVSAMLPAVATTPRSVLGFILFVLFLLFQWSWRGQPLFSAAHFGWLSFLIASTATVSYSAIILHDSLLIVFAILAVLALFCFTFVNMFRKSSLAFPARFTYLLPLHSLFLLINHGRSRATPVMTWSDFDVWGQSSALSGNQLVVLAVLATFINGIFIALFEFWLRKLAPHSTSSPSTHSPAAAPAPPSQAEP